MSENQSFWPGRDPSHAAAQPPFAQPSGPPAAPPAASIPPPLAPPFAQPPSPTGLPPAAPAPPPEPRPGRLGRGLVAGAAALVLSLGSGLVGAYAATQWDEDSPAVTNVSSAPAAPVVERSSLADIAASVQPSVVSIATGSGEGSGVVLSADGSILTNNHVVAGARGGLTVTFSDGKTARATIVGTDPKTDLAVIKADRTSGLTPAKFGDSDAMRVGDTVLALGSPLGLQGSVTAGIVSALNRTIQAGGGQGSPFEQPAATSISGTIQTDAAINPGNSGGALVNLNGEVIGVNTAIATAGGGNGNIGVGFAIPSNRAKQVAEALTKGEKVSHPYLGVQVTTATGGGALVGAVSSGGPADRAGLRRGDVITKVGDRTITDSDDLVSAVQSGKVGERLDITYTRDGTELKATVTLAEAS